MPQLVFIHGPGAGACAEAFHYQLKHFPKSVAPDLPGHLEGTRCPDVRATPNGCAAGCGRRA